MSAFGNSELRVEVEAAIVAEMKRVGPKAFDRKTIIRQFASSGVHQATLYRWIDKAIESGVPGQAIARQVKSATAARIKRHKKPEAAAKAAATDVVASLPVAVTLDDIAGLGGVVPAIEQLNFIIATCRTIIAQAQGDDPTKVRQPKLAMAACDLLRRSLETGARIAKDLTDVANTQRFHDAIFDILQEESPAFAQKVLVRMRQLNVLWLSKVE